MMENLYDLSLVQIHGLMEELGEPGYRADQLWEGLYQQGWTKADEFTTLPQPLRHLLGKRYAFGTLQAEKELSSTDNTTRKYLYRLQDNTAIETVLMDYDRRTTACVSSQVGCAMGCSFCATGNMGLTRNLTKGEIVEQVLKSAALARQLGSELSNVVFMGMGEPFHNYDNVLSALRTLNDPLGIGMGMRRFTISTVGLVPGIRRFTEERIQANLAISLHAADDDLRSSMIPINNKYPIDELMDACEDYLRETNRRITIEWALIDGVNDTAEQAEKLAHLLRGKLYHVNLIQLNPVAHFSGKPAKDQNAETFRRILLDVGVSCTIRLRRGIDIQAGCGQLASQEG